jgi:tRNA1(Val) A37 N6-methylase TrmN6
MLKQKQNSTFSAIPPKNLPLAGDNGEAMGQGQAMSVTVNSLLNGQVRLKQPAAGYRAGMDAVLLAAACQARAGARVLDAGCGVGAVMLAAARLNPALNFVGLERDADMAALAQENILLNGLAGRVALVRGEVGSRFADLGLTLFDAALANPPFFDDDTVLRGPAAAKRDAWITAEGLAGWTAFLISSVREGGMITLIHRADRLGDILAALTPKCGSFQIRPIAPFVDAPAKRVLVRAVKTGKAPLQLLAPLILHEREGAKHTPRAEAILRGEAGLAWD